ncbi:MAG: 1-acyl-sn-glycerol-3-phosphate acyltransferase [Bacteroidales bacterium]|nr:1-acyl-sn-glycerol-3-phosphate acyltransferase [Bacteroidales bacterium]MBP5635044.1 1-acyl-sn-glycerol-3-phosphate acyltransferase [Bacteroidales bacterium]
MQENHTVILDLDQIVRSRFGEKKIPGFIVNRLKKFIHQDHLNGFLKQGWLGIDFLEKALEYYDVHITVEGLDRIPDTGRFTFAGNHPLGGIDAIGVIASIGRKYDGRIVVPANDFLMAIGPIAEYTIPVNKMGGQSADLVRLINDAFRSDRQVVIFPAGLCSRKIDGVVQDLPWKKTFITKSRETQRDIIPVWFSGRNSWRFYFLDRLRNLLKIKFNIAMAALPDELYRCQHKSYRLVFGEPIPWQTFTAEKKDAEWAAWVRGKVYELQR